MISDLIGREIHPQYLVNVIMAEQTYQFSRNLVSPSFPYVCCLNMLEGSIACYVLELFPLPLSTAGASLILSDNSP